MIPAATLKAPLFSASHPDALNFGAIGAVIAHEFSHGFDDLGSYYDLNGNQNNWWTYDSRIRFFRLAKCFVNQYGNQVDSVTGLNVSINVPRS